MSCLQNCAQEFQLLTEFALFRGLLNLWITKVLKNSQFVPIDQFIVHQGEVLTTGRHSKVYVSIFVGREREDR